MNRFIPLIIFVCLILGCTKDDSPPSSTGNYKCNIKFRELYSVAPFRDTTYYTADTLNVSANGDSLLFYDKSTFKFNGFSIKSKIGLDTFEYPKGREYGYGFFLPFDSLFIFKQTNITAGIRYSSFCNCKKIN